MAYKTAEPKYRKKLNPGQIEVLELLYKFRFGSSNLIAHYFGKGNGVFVYKRLQILQEQGYIGKRFDGSYRLQGRPAAYYLLPAGARELQNHRGHGPDEVVNVKALYKYKTVSDAFIRHCMNLFALYNQLKAYYGDKLDVFTKSDCASYTHFPQPLPDVFLSLAARGVTKYFFMDIFENGQPFFTFVKRIKQYIEYQASGEWSVTGADFPVILLWCETVSIQKRIHKQITTLLASAWDDDVTFATITKDDLVAHSAGGIPLWSLANREGVRLPISQIS